MSEEQKEKSGLKATQIVATALAAVTAAVLGSTLGVAGTVTGAALASVVTSVGSELYVRSLHRTREAARRAKELTAPGLRGVRAYRTERGHAEQPTAHLPLPASLADQPTVPLAKPSGKAGDERRVPRWAVVAATSVLAFVLAVIGITAYETASGHRVSGGGGTTFFGGGSGSGGGGQDRTSQTGPAPDRTTPGAPGTESPSPSTSGTPPASTEPATPTTTGTTPPASGTSRAPGSSPKLQVTPTSPAGAR